MDIDELEKRQRLQSSDSNQIKENKKKQSNLEVMVPEKYTLDVKDTLLTLCPINNMRVVNTQGQEASDRDLFISTGHFTGSTISIIRSFEKGFTTAEKQKSIFHFPGMEKVFTISFQKVTYDEA